jgi:hypothetical protein
MEPTKELFVSESGTFWGVLNRTWTTADGIKYTELSYWPDRPNFVSLVHSDPLDKVGETRGRRSLDHRLIMLAQELAIIPGMHHPGQFTKLRAAIAALMTNPTSANCYATGRMIKRTMIGSRHGTLTMKEIAEVLKAFVGA